MLIALDRQEGGQGRAPPFRKWSDYGAHIIAIIQMSDLIQYLEEAGRTAGAGGATGRHEGLPRPVRYLSRRVYRAIVEGGAVCSLAANGRRFFICKSGSCGLSYPYSKG